jgi:hypothetical protein
LSVAHSIRFRRVANLYPWCVAKAYDGDLARAAADSDARVAATVAAWERRAGLAPRDWRAIGRREEGRGLYAGDELGAAGNRRSRSCEGG